MLTGSEIAENGKSMVWPAWRKWREVARIGGLMERAIASRGSGGCEAQSIIPWHQHLCAETQRL